MKTFILPAILLILITGTTVQAETATEIVRKSDLQMRGESSYTETTMQIIRPDWTRTMSMKGWSKGADYSLVLVTSPARDKGSSSLKRNKEMWNWIPSIERVIKIAPSMLGQSWMGSDFTNDDLINQSSIVVDYTHRLLGQESFDGTDCWVIEATPKEDAPVVWGKLILHISKDQYHQRKIAYYDEFGELINTLTTLEVKEIGGRMLPTRMEMQPADKPGQKTVLTYQLATFDFDLPTRFFSQSNMKELRE
jgi:outer membrane lipoprotein-sorting protein